MEQEITSPPKTEEKETRRSSVICVDDEKFSWIDERDDNGE